LYCNIDKLIKINKIIIHRLNFGVSLLILVQEIQAEGRHAIDSPGNPNAPEMPPEDYELSA